MKIPPRPRDGSILAVASLFAATTAIAQNSPPAVTPLAPAASVATAAAASPATSGKPAISTKTQNSDAKAKGLHFAPEPIKNHNDYVIAELKLMAGRKDAGMPIIKDLDSLKLTDPIANYNIDVGRLALLGSSKVPPGTGLETAEASRYFTFLVESDGQPFQTITVDVDIGPNSNSGWSDMGTGINLNPTALHRMLDALAARDEVRTGSYEVRFLKILDLFRQGFETTVIWLKSDPDGADLVYIPTPSANSSLPAEKLYAANEFLKIVEPLAFQKLGTLKPTESRPNPLGNHPVLPAPTPSK